jgi:hypothetical protein
MGCVASPDKLQQGWDKGAKPSGNFEIFGQNPSLKCQA